MPPSNNRSPPYSGARHKSVLYCPECGHESPVDGDWHIGRDDMRASKIQASKACERSAFRQERVVYACPVCEHVITTRPTYLVSA